MQWSTSKLSLRATIQLGMSSMRDMDMAHAQELHDTVPVSSRGGLLEDWTDWCCSVSTLWDVDAKETF
eukprot:11220230-Ditylum_brightwellii.AAC.2